MLHRRLFASWLSAAFAALLFALAPSAAAAPGVDLVKQAGKGPAQASVELANTTWVGGYQYLTMPEPEPLTIEFLSNGRARVTHIGQTQEWTYSVEGADVVLMASSGSTWAAPLGADALDGVMHFPGHGDGVFSVRPMRPGFDLSQLTPEVRRAAELARAEENRGRLAAVRARTGFGGTMDRGPEGDLYAGEDVGNGQTARGLQVFPDGATYAGTYVRGEPDHFSGHGVYRFPDGRVYEGQWANSQYSGYGVVWDANGRVLEAGTWANNHLTSAMRREPAAPPYDLRQLHPDVRAAAEAARATERRANAAAERARATAQRAEASGRQAPGDGLGVEYYAGDFAGDRYAGDFRGGYRDGLGVMYNAQNANNTVGALRYEGEWGAGGNSHGLGVHYWANGERHAGEYGENMFTGTGVYYYEDGSRYEGQWADNRRSGYGVLWDAQGQVWAAGVWANHDLATPLSR